VPDTLTMTEAVRGGVGTITIVVSLLNCTGMIRWSPAPRQWVM
jgi:hypothetical protein